MSSVDEAIGNPSLRVVTRTAGEGQGSLGPVVRVRNLSKRDRHADGTFTAALDDVSLDVHAGQVVLLVGPPGGGASTLVRAIAGLVAPDAGMVEINGEPCFDAARGHDVAPEHRPVGLVSPAAPLPPDLTALEAVEARLRARRSSGDGSRRSGHADEARAMLVRLGADDVAGRRPHEMTAAQRQRVALARALVTGTGLVLLDDPLAGVEPRRRGPLRAELLALQRELGFTAVVVTHDHRETTHLAHRLAVMDRGRIAQVGRPGEVYREPRSRAAAVMTGTANEVPGRLTGLDERTGTARVATPLGEVTGRSGPAPLAVGDDVVALWRPERTRLMIDEPAGVNRWPVTVEASLYLGEHSQHVVISDGGRLLIWHEGSSAPAWFPPEGAAGWVRVDPDDVRVLPAAD
jgi:iron(III) transport system ATP-binding protein